MIGKKIASVALIVVAASGLQADIYDDYKLLAEAITINSEKIKKLDNKNEVEMASVLGKLEGEHAKLKEKIKELELKLSKKSCNHIATKNNSIAQKDFLRLEQRAKLLKVIEENREQK